MGAIKSRRSLALIASSVLVTSLFAAASAGPVAATPDAEHAAAKQARSEARAEAKAARQAAKQARAQARADAKAARQAAKQARAEATAQAKAARKAAKLAAGQKVTICHKPGTSAEGTLVIAASAVDAHLAHGDVEGGCEPDGSQALDACEGSGSPDVDPSTDGIADEYDGDACEGLADEPEQVLVAIDAPESIGAQEDLWLEGAVLGLQADDAAYAWSSTCLTDEELTDPAIIAGEPDAPTLVVRGGTLPPGTTCDFTLTVTDEVTGSHGAATVAVEVVALP